jgi:hypothetical protein
MFLKSSFGLLMNHGSNSNPAFCQLLVDQVFKAGFQPLLDSGLDMVQIVNHVSISIPLSVDLPPDHYPVLPPGPAIDIQLKTILMIIL